MEDDVTIALSGAWCGVRGLTVGQVLHHTATCHMTQGIYYVYFEIFTQLYDAILLCPQAINSPVLYITGC